MKTGSRIVILASILVAVLALTACPQPAPPPPAEHVDSAADKAAKVAETNKAATMKFFSEVASQGKVEVLDQIVAPDFVDHQPAPPGSPTGLEGLKAYITAYRQAFPDLSATAEQIVASGDMVAIRSVWKGTQKGEWMGAKPSGKQYSFEVFDIVRFKDGKAVEHWGTDNSAQVLMGGGK
jgi:predicted ester cyclase